MMGVFKNNLLTSVVFNAIILLKSVYNIYENILKNVKEVFGYVIQKNSEVY